ncbi:hypothetical protein RNZ50_16595 [Paracoccaceae bacterium Fryx2]|nr:hypothetical protein [Paracoccaceae bacterium Fryx2]
MIKKVERIAQLRELLLRMESELGLLGLTRFERDLLYAVRSLAPDGGEVRSSALRRHKLVETMTQPTFHRALRELVDQGYLRRAEGSHAAYCLVARDPQ